MAEGSDLIIIATPLSSYNQIWPFCHFFGIGIWIIYYL
jgi:hypothetical protein